MNEDEEDVYIELPEDATFADLFGMWKLFCRSDLRQNNEASRFEESQKAIPLSGAAF